MNKPGADSAERDFSAGLVEATRETLIAELARLRDERAVEAKRSRRIEEASLLQSECLANMSHELRTPLNAIVGFAELMFKGKVGPIADNHREYLGDILDSSRDLLRLIDDILGLARVESERLEFRPQPIDVAKVVTHVRDILRGPASARRIRMELELDPTLTTVSLDPAKFKQVLYSYLSDTLKLTPEQGRVTIRVAPEALDRFCIEIESTHLGERDEAEHCAGIGLELSKQLIEAQSGHVAVRRELGRGTVLRLVLPLHTPSFSITE